jgi:replication factor C large subunit
VAEASAAAPAPRALRTNDWTEKHRPQSLAELVGNSKAIEELRAWAERWNKGVPDEEKAAILAGEPGVGKTSAAHALARDLGWGVIELNASDQRNEEVIRRIAGSGARNMAFGADGAFSKEGGGRQLVILDEADNLFGREDRGGMKAIVDTIREARQPIVLIANDLYELQRKGAALKGLARTIKFTKVHSRSIPPALKRIAQKEGIELETGVAEALAERAGGDMRSAVNDFQALAIGRARIAVADVQTLGARDTTGDVWGMLGKVFYGQTLDEARKSAWDLDETPESLALWIDENLPVMYTNKADLVDGYAALSRADVYVGRVVRRQQYGLWSYATEMLTAGVALAKRERPSGARFQFPSWLRKQSASKAMRELRNRTASKVGAAIHTSGARVRMDVFPYLKILMRADEEFATWAAWSFDLEADELAFLLDAKPTSAQIKKMLEQAAAKYAVYDRQLAAPAAGRGRFLGDVEEDVIDDEEEAEAADDDEDDAPEVQAAAPAKPSAEASDDAAKPAATPKEDAKPPKKQRNLFDF